MRRFVNISVLLWMLSGCATTSLMTQQSPSSQIDTWLAQQEYEKALNAIEAIPAEHAEYPQVRARKTEVEKLARRYEEESSAEVWKLQDRGDWAAAIERLDEALDKMPKSSRLAEDKTRLYAEQEKQENIIAYQQRRARAQWLVKQLELQRDMVRVSANGMLEKWTLSRLESDAEGLANELTDDALVAQADGRITQARSDLNLALKLHAVARAEEALAAMEKSSKQQARKRQVSAKSKKENELAELGQKYASAMADENWQQARDAARTLLKKAPANKEYKENLARVEQRVAEAVDELYAQGVALYSRGEYEQAAGKWRAALELDPGHEPSRENLMRAERVIKRLERLRNKQQ